MTLEQKKDVLEQRKAIREAVEVWATVTGAGQVHAIKLRKSDALRIVGEADGKMEVVVHEPGAGGSFLYAKKVYIRILTIPRTGPPVIVDEG